jgi:UTP--glucose-1-phosphate uridylyltransferase
MLPVLNRPVIDYIVQDCIAAGVTEFYFVVGEDCAQLRSYYGRNLALEQHLKDANKQDMLGLVAPPKNIKFEFIVQNHGSNKPYGTSVPVWLAYQAMPDDGQKTLVIMGDQFIYNGDGQSEAAYFLKNAQDADTDSAMLAIEVPQSEVSKYGIIAAKSNGNIELFDHIVEKPKPHDAPSNLNNASFYLFDRYFFDFLQKDISRAHDGEFRITDSLNEYVSAGNDIAIIRNKGEYLDCGTVNGWLHANNRIINDL